MSSYESLDEQEFDAQVCYGRWTRNQHHATSPSRGGRRPRRWRSARSAESPSSAPRSG